MRRYIGLDVHRDYCYAHLLEAGQGEGRRLRFPNTAEGWAEFVAQLGPEDAVALEVSSGAFRFYDILADRAGQVVVVDARVMRRLGSRKRKTDRDDAKLLAERLALGTLAGVWVPPAAIRELRALINLRRQLVEQRSRWKNQIRAVLLRHGCRAPRGLWRSRIHLEQLWRLSLPEGERVWLAVALEQLRSTTEHLRAVERDIAQRVKDCRPVRQLLSIVGFHVIAAATYYAYVGDPWRFPSGKHVVSYAGLAPRVRQSGTVDRRGGISKEGPRVLRWALVEAASAAARHGPPTLRTFYLRLRATKGHQVAVVAVAAKRARIAWTLWRTGQLFTGIRSERYAAKLSVLDQNAAPYPTAQVMAWLAGRLERIVDRAASSAGNNGRATRAVLRASA